MQKGHMIKIISGDYEGRAAEIIDIDEDKVTVKLFHSTETAVLKPEEVKRKKLCVCGLSKDYPFCDGSHASG
jgi:transcription antitermination factor NusG